MQLMDMCLQCAQVNNALYPRPISKQDNLSMLFPLPDCLVYLKYKTSCKTQDQFTWFSCFKELPYLEKWDFDFDSYPAITAITYTNTCCQSELLDYSFGTKEGWKTGKQHYNSKIWLNLPFLLMGHPSVGWTWIPPQITWSIVFWWPTVQPALVV